MPNLTITSPRPGDYLNRNDGELRGDALIVPVAGTCPAGAFVTVNGAAATVTGETWRAEVPLTRNNWVIEAAAGEQRAEITVMPDLSGKKRYRFSVDDNIQFLRDLGTEPDSFASLFDHWYLAFWRRMHDEYGAKIHLNTYYQTEDASWNTSLMPDKWRDEWEANAEWLHLSFHALMDKPDRIYRAATYDRMANDYELVVNEIKRYAGEAVLTNETTVHWAEAPVEACRALKDRGIDILIGLFWVRDGRCTTNYYLDLSTTEYCNTRDAWMDVQEGLTFVTCDAVVNGLALEDCVPTLEQQAAGPHTGELIELLIHEQYFRPDLIYWPQGSATPARYYQPDIQQKVETCLRWVSEHGYEPCFWSEGLLGAE